MAKEIDLDDGIIYITDQQNMVDIMTANINLNSTIISHIEACELDWYLPLLPIPQYPYFRAAAIPEHLANPDIVLAADCVYFEPAFPLLHQTLLRLTSHGEVVVYMAYKKRRKVGPCGM